MKRKATLASFGILIALNGYPQDSPSQVPSLSKTKTSRVECVVPMKSISLNKKPFFENSNLGIGFSLSHDQRSNVIAAEKPGGKCKTFCNSFGDCVWSDTARCLQDKFFCYNSEYCT